MMNVMTVGNRNLYIVLIKSSSYFRVRQEDADCLIDVKGLSSSKETLWQILARRHVSVI
jgi:hypothetical protein